MDAILAFTMLININKKILRKSNTTHAFFNLY